MMMSPLSNRAYTLYFFVVLTCLLSECISTTTTSTSASSTHRQENEDASTRNTRSVPSARFDALRDRAMNNPMIPNRLLGKTIADITTEVNTNERNLESSSSSSQQQQQRQTQQNSRPTQSNRPVYNFFAVRFVFLEFGLYDSWKL
jgi:hypothetical protein